MRFKVTLLAVVLVVAACGAGEQAAEDSTPTTDSAPIEETTTVPPTTSTTTTPTVNFATTSAAPLELTDVRIEDLVGKWVQFMGYVDEYTADGGWFRCPSSPSTTCRSYVGGSTVFGTYQLEENILTIQHDEESTFCSGKVGVYEVGLTSDGSLHMSLVEEECARKRAVIGDSSVLMRVES